MESENVRVEEMLEKPSPQNVDTTFGQPSLGPPSLLFDHPHLVKRSLLPQADGSTYPIVLLYMGHCIHSGWGSSSLFVAKVLNFVLANMYQY